MACFQKVETYEKINSICCGLIKCVHEYLQGFPATAFNSFKGIMDELIKYPFKVYQKSKEYSPKELYNDTLSLYRCRTVDDNSELLRKDLFHVPYDSRTKINTCRYSIAGYPCLYLSTNLKLSYAEIGKERNGYQFSKFQLQRDEGIHGIEIRLLELAVRPKDYFEYNNNNIKKKKFDEIDLSKYDTMHYYLLWYPLIASCSFIRKKREDPFAEEYIIPQLLMQWLRRYSKRENVLYGIRYFSCFSRELSDNGFNYVFPVSGNKSEKNSNYCKILTEIFKLTTPYYIEDIKDIKKVKKHFCNKNDYDFL